jgi:MFS family permease
LIAASIGAVLAIIGVVIQTAAQNIAMFVIARIIVGFGTAASAIAAPVYLAETMPVKYRAWALAILYDFWYVGTYSRNCFARELLLTLASARGPYICRGDLRHGTDGFDVGVAAPICVARSLQSHLHRPDSLHA